MATTIDVAQYIYNKLGWIDSGRLMKLTYNSRAWSLGWFGRSIVVEEFQAWSDGPVEPNLHSENKYLIPAPRQRIFHQRMSEGCQTQTKQ